MAKKKGRVYVMLKSESGSFKLTSVSPNATDKISLRKYDPKLRKHVLFKETKLR